MPTQIEEFERDLIAQLNKDSKEKIAYNLSIDAEVATIKRWISTGSKLLDYAISNRRDGGLPEGRIVEIFGPPSVGKSHIALQIAKSVQKMGGMCVYIDTEHATSLENLASLGVNVETGFVFIEQSCTEHIFAAIDTVVTRSASTPGDAPIVIVWDSVAASSPKAEIEGKYDKDTVGIQARAMSKGLRKIMSTLMSRPVLLVCLNQTRTKIGTLPFQDPTTTPGGNALPFYASVRIQLFGGQKVKHGDDVVGIKVTAKVVKNKVSRPQRRAQFNIIFGKGIDENEQLFDVLKAAGSIELRDKMFKISDAGAWKRLVITNSQKEIVLEKKFNKNEFSDLIRDTETSSFIEEAMETLLTAGKIELSDQTTEDTTDETES